MDKGKTAPIRINDNTINKFQKLKDDITAKKEVGFSAQEKVFINKMAEGSDVKGIVRSASMLDPRGRMMILIGAGMGTVGGAGALLAGGVGGIAGVMAVPAMGAAATRHMTNQAGRTGAKLLRETSGSPELYDIAGKRSVAATGAAQAAAQQVLGE